MARAKSIAHSSITIHNLPPGVKQRLRVRAAQHGRSLEAEAREILQATVTAATAPAEHLFDRIHARFAALGGVEIALPPRGLSREPPSFAADESGPT